ncbi:DUF7405 family protein [Natrinema halophilum]|uniref:Tat pathway signal protein n=1 Tax=Natrinema halophilum TaxID=1699371 RepID=A0A7D5KRT9_9EURY|nr:hypothetical protein [Natrinema halophilum]QLG49677.1 hypothetical protein HYG82_12800 [Natrinema halophilum]
MPCRHARIRTREQGDTRGLERREFMKSALTIGGASALSAAMGVTGLTGTVEASDGGVDAPDRRNRQHAWADFLERNAQDVPHLPAHQLLLFVNYDRSGEPTPEDRNEMEGALDQIEQAFQWNNEGVLFTVSYSRTYFERFDDELPQGIDLKRNREFIDSLDVPNEDPIPEDAEILIHLTSDTVANLLAVEEALWGEMDDLNGVPIEHTFEGLFDRPTGFPERRTGFVGSGVPREEIERDDIPEDAPLSMGFESLFQDAVPSEDDVTIVENQTLAKPMPPGPFAQGFIQHASSLNLELESWYDESLEMRTARMFSPYHHPDEIGEIADELGDTTDLEGLPMRDPEADDDIARRTQQDAEEFELVGHLQKLVRARFDLSERDADAESDGELDTTILRRDFNTTDMETESGLHFIALMRFNGYMAYVRKAMSGVGFQGSEEIPLIDEDEGPQGEPFVDHDDVDIPEEANGFHSQIEATRRGNFLLPPLSMRSLPQAQGCSVEINVSPRRNGQVVNLEERHVCVAVFDLTESPDGIEQAQFGRPKTVNQLRGANPVSRVFCDLTGDGTTDALLLFETNDLEFEPGEETGRIVMYNDRGEPIHRSVDLTVTESDRDPFWH